MNFPLYLKTKMDLADVGVYLKFKITNLLFYHQMVISTFSSGTALPDSEIPNLQFNILFPTGDLISLIGDNISGWGYVLLGVYSRSEMMQNKRNYSWKTA